jgi:hypothetical protein
MLSRLVFSIVFGTVILFLTCPFLNSHSMPARKESAIARPGEFGWLPVDISSSQNLLSSQNFFEPFSKTSFVTSYCLLRGENWITLDIDPVCCLCGDVAAQASYRTFAMNLISISCVGSASRGVTRIVLATSGLFAPYASFRTGPATANAISMSVT